MIGDLLGDFKLAAVLQVGGYAGGAKSVVADLRLDAGGGRAALDDAVGVLLPERFPAENAGVSGSRLEEWLIRIAGVEACGGDVSVEEFFQGVVARHFMFLASFFMQPHPAAAPLDEVVTHLHSDHGADACKGVNHETDESAIAQAGEVGRLADLAVRIGSFNDHGDAVEQGARFVYVEHGRLPFLDDVLGAAHGMGRVDFENLAGDEPVEEHPESGQVLLHRGGRHVPLQVLDEGGDVEGLDAGQLGQAVGFAPSGETAGRVQVGAAGVVVVDLRGEEFEKAPGGLRVWGEQASGLKFRSRREGDFSGFHRFYCRV